MVRFPRIIPVPVRAEPLVKAKVPSLTKVLPVKVLIPDRVNVPVPAFVREVALVLLLPMMAPMERAAEPHC